MTALYRCELAETLLCSPVASLVPEDARHLLRWLLMLTKEQAVDPEQLTVAEHIRWPLARCPAGLPAVIAAATWPARTDVRRAVDEAVDAATVAVLAVQLATRRAGWLVLDRRSGLRAQGVPILAERPAALCPTDVAFDLRLEPTGERIRGLLLGPLAAWPPQPLRERRTPIRRTLPGMATTHKTDPTKMPPPPAQGDPTLTSEQERLADEHRRINPGQPATKPHPPTPDNPQSGIVGPGGATSVDPARSRQQTRE